MRYLVMECHPGYAVVLDEEGRFFKVANLNYEVGQRVDSVVKMKTEASSHRIRNRIIKAASLVACICLMILGSWNFLFMPYGTVRMQINPDILIVSNRLGYVIDLEEKNEDGAELIKDYQFRFKKYTKVSKELANEATVRGYLSEDGTIRIIVESKHTKWKETVQEQIIKELKELLGDKVNVTTEQEEKEVPSEHKKPQTQPQTQPVESQNNDSMDVNTKNNGNQRKTENRNMDINATEEIEESDDANDDVDELHESDNTDDSEEKSDETDDTEDKEDKEEVEDDNGADNDTEDGDEDDDDIDEDDDNLEDDDDLEDDDGTGDNGELDEENDVDEMEESDEDD